MTGNNKERIIGVLLENVQAGNIHIHDIHVHLPDKLPPLWVDVPILPNHFVGRDQLVEELVQRMVADHVPALAVHGLPGAGKSALAVVLAYYPKLLEHFTDGILWASLGPNPNIMIRLNTWATALDIEVNEGQTAEQLQQEIRSKIGQRKILLIIDDVWEAEAAELMRCGGPYCSHLLTTRDLGIARDFAGSSRVFAVSSLPEKPAFQLLQLLAPEACATNQPAASKLALDVGGLPLALVLIGGFLAVPERSLFPELSEVALKELNDPARRLELAGKRLEAADSRQLKLQETIELSLKHLPQPAVDAFYALGAFAPKPEQFSLDAAEVVTGADKRTLALLVARNLAEKVSQEETKTQLALHQVLADVAQTKLDEAAVIRHRDYYLGIVNEDREDWRRIEKIYGQIKWAWQSLPEDNELLEVVWALREYQERRGLWHDCLAWAQRGLDLVKENEWREDEATLLNNIGLVYHNLGQGEKALEYYHQALPITEEGGDRAVQATTINNIGLVYHNLGQREKALEFYQKVLPIQEEVNDRAGQAGTLTNIGATYNDLGQPDEALKYYNLALPITEEVSDRALQATTLNNIGSVYDNLGQREKALEYYNQALRISGEVGDRAGEATTINNIGVVYDSLGQREKALEYYHQALPIKEEVSDRAGQAKTLTNIGGVYDSLGQREKALEYYQKVLPITEEVSDWALQVTALNKIGEVYYRMRRLDQALECFVQALIIHEELGDRAGEATTINNIGVVYDSLGQREKALEYYHQALPIKEEVSDRAGQAKTLTNIGGVYDSLGQREKALEYYYQALPIQEEVGDRAGQAQSLNNIGFVYDTLGQWEKALEYYYQALPIWEEVGDRAGQATTLYNMTTTYRGQGHLEEAVALLKQLVKLDRLLQHPDLQSDIAMLAEVAVELAAEQEIE